jgi:hypothetical protein
MELLSEENKRLVEYGLGGIVGLIGAGYLAPYLNSNVYELVGGLVVLGGTLYFINGTAGWKGPVKLLGSVLGLIFVVRGILGFVPSVASQVSQYTLNIL